MELLARKALRTAFFISISMLVRSFEHEEKRQADGTLGKATNKEIIRFQSLFFALPTKRSRRHVTVETFLDEWREICFNKFYVDSILKCVDIL